ncbi:MAG: alpha-glucan phosphorylase [Ignavibacteria bacterium RBG_16_34_14]|nr:MAG: alpha-glucan phosphorylase [Ignavibacteria bacterium RBG_16_34_14]
MYKFLGTYNVIPSLPGSLEHLREVAYNLMWTWNPEARELFRRLDRELWEDTNHNSVMVLGNVSQERLEEVSHDDGFKSHLDRVCKSLQDYLKAKTWYNKNFSHSENFNIIYFSAEFGLTECLQTYSGGLGVLAGDHLKASSDLGIPLIGVGLLYREGYFQQYLNSDGWQHERYELNDFNNLPMKMVMNEKNEPFTLSVRYDSKEVFFQVWKIDVGRVPLYLLDTNVPQNSEADRKITRALYGGNIETRIEQEIILGIGGIKTMKALNIQPMVCHMNEGHSAFMALERMRFLIHEEGLSYKEAREIGFYSNIFTTHTPVPAGIDVFSNELVEKYLGKFYKDELKISDKEFYSLGTIYKDKESSFFNMAHLAMNTAGYVNGVSKLHGSVSKKMWVSGYKDVPFNEIPIDYITNGVHLRSHISREMEGLFVQYIGENWVNNPVSEQFWKRIDNIPDEELWRTHERRRERLVAFARRRLARQAKARGESQAEIAIASEVLDPTALTIGFARRFATYKRATLIFKDVERLADILNNKSQPVQFIIAGKAHPKDEEGKRLIQEICQIAKDDRFRRRIVFIENYDINVARYMVEGCDVWLNTPRRPLEASGTSGMKVIANGGLNFSILDGWWAEGFDPEVGWKIGNGEEYTDHDYQDEVEARQLYHILETQIVPLFYTRAEDLLPRGWITKVKNSMKKLGPIFNTHRMVQEYFEKFYERAYEKRKELQQEKWSKAIELAGWKEKVKQKWSKIKVEKVLNGKNSKSIYVGEEFPVDAEINLGELTPDDVEVQLYYGPVEKQDDPEFNSTVVMSPAKNTGNGVINYKGKIITKHSGQQGFTIRIVPQNPMLISSFEVGVVYWAT